MKTARRPMGVAGSASPSSISLETGTCDSPPLVAAAAAEQNDAPIELTPNRRTRPGGRGIRKATDMRIRRIHKGLAALAVATAMLLSAVLPAYATSTASSLNCHGLQATIVGTSHDDSLSGTAGNDVVVLLDGNDFFDGLGGNDVVCGGDGNDLLVGGPGNDLLDGGTGNDTLRGDVFAPTGDATGEGGDDTLSCGEGNSDRAGGDNYAPNGNASGNGGNDLIVGCESATGDNLACGQASGNGGDDVIMGARAAVGDNNNPVFCPPGGTTSGTGGNDTITGTSGGDPILIGDNSGAGGGGNDVISGLSGPDSIDGGLGFDICDGSRGKDTATNCETVIDIP
ncbi:MAG: calcium-binding protein [Candidatus Limnocylindrales bacterium]